MKEKHFNLLRWLPAIASIGVVILIVFISAITLADLKKATYWRKHTFEVILNAQAYEDRLMDAQSRIRRYATAGTATLLIEYQNDTNSELQEFNKLAELTRDNPDQQRRLKELDAAMKAVFDYDNRVIGVYARQGAEAATQLERTSEPDDVLEPAIMDLEKFKNEEEKLLDKRDATEQKDYHKTARLLVGGSLFAAGLLVVANFFAGREMSRRRRAETKQRELIEELQKALAEVKTLSGLIPICAWCKHVRDDEGFWQSVESYVSSHTGAKFTHGMCTACSSKWQKDAMNSRCGTTK